MTSKPKLQDDVGDGHQKNTKRGEARDKNTKLPEKSPKKRKLSNDTRPERTAPVAAERENGVSGDEQSDSDSEGSVPEHEVVTALKSKKKRKSAKTRIAPEDETQETRDARTVFLGNLPVSIVKSKVCFNLFLKFYALSNVISLQLQASPKTAAETHTWSRTSR